MIAHLRIEYPSVRLLRTKYMRMTGSHAVIAWKVHRNDISDVGISCVRFAGTSFNSPQRGGGKRVGFAKGRGTPKGRFETCSYREGRGDVAAYRPLWIPAYAGMTGLCGYDGAVASRGWASPAKIALLFRAPFAGRKGRRLVFECAFGG